MQTLLFETCLSIKIHFVVQIKRAVFQLGGIHEFSAYLHLKLVQMLRPHCYGGDHVVN